MKKCPVCSSKDLKIDRDFIDYILLEEYIGCNRCSFYYEFIHGNERYYFGKYKFVFYWNESRAKYKKRSKVMESRIKKHRKIVKHLYKLKW